MNDDRLETMICLDHPCFGWDIWRPVDEREAVKMRGQGYMPISEVCEKILTQQKEIEHLTKERNRLRQELTDLHNEMYTMRTYSGDRDGSW